MDTVFITEGIHCVFFSFWSFLLSYIVSVPLGLFLLVFHVGDSVVDSLVSLVI